MQFNIIRIVYLCTYILTVGKGPLRKYYEEMIKTKNLIKVKICTLWLSSEDYSLLVGKLSKLFWIYKIFHHVTTEHTVF